MIAWKIKKIVTVILRSFRLQAEFKLKKKNEINLIVYKWKFLSNQSILFKNHNINRIYQIICLLFVKNQDETQNVIYQSFFNP